ncbi:hypothetical protein [Paenibacillus agricola]|uniref:Uncharacterized protein n=1 Tax=Paenibacillus agricola TaxID=2716264 RepID=A0ABX0J4C3_9BACL|nr:hypothetical protein [Paenibacillus agricola]NHN31175.1 hypothetical protein [Paenibacillus agricola]
MNTLTLERPSTQQTNAGGSGMKPPVRVIIASGYGDNPYKAPHLTPFYRQERG